MSAENVQIVSAMYEAAGTMDREQLLAALPELIAGFADPGIEWVEDPGRADGRTYRGHEGVRESFERWLEGFDAYGFSVDRVLDCGGDDVLVYAREEGTGAASGAAVSSEIFQLITLREGRVLRFREYYDRGAAEAAAGLG
ncbi:MAG: nuclear transport factor 2 family protein [Solirubrobacterales bacterium]